MIGILGGGLAGLTVAKHCKQPCEVLEASDRVGGHCKSTIEQGYTFDEGPHIIFSKNKKTLDYMLSLLGDNVVQGRRNNKIYYRTQFIKYPFENGIGELEPQERYDCVNTFLNRGGFRCPVCRHDVHQYLPCRVQTTTTGGDGPYRCDCEYRYSFRDWLYFTYGQALTEKYLLPYNEKIWKCPTELMASDWANQRLPQISAETLMKSACGLPTEGYEHQLNFYYPKTGGVESLVKATAKDVKNICTDWHVSNVSKVRDKWRVESVIDKKFSLRAEARIYDKIVSTLPLVEMVDIFTGVPQEIKDAAKQLRFNSLITVTLGYTEYASSTSFTAVYVPSAEKLFHRLSFPRNFSWDNGPTIQAEITTNVNDDVWGMTDGDLIQRVCRGLLDMGLYKEHTYAKVQRLKYGYPVPTFSYRENLKKVRTYFEEQGVILCGRNAEFEYINMDQCIEHGIQVAESL